MNDPREVPPTQQSLDRRLMVETPEQVSLGLQLAGLGSRVLATIVDWMVVALLFIAAVFAMALASLPGMGGAWLTALFVIVFFLLQWGYFALFEAFRKGQTPGKRMVGIRVVMDTGHPVTVQAAIIRNLIRIVDLQPGFSGLVGVAFMLFHPQARRLGDMVAGTVVARGARSGTPRDIAEPPPPPPSSNATRVTSLRGAARLADQEFRVLNEFLERSAKLPKPAYHNLVTRLSNQFAERFPELDARRGGFLRAVYRAEQAARAGAGVGRAAPQGPAIAERFRAARGAAWAAFERRVKEIERAGMRRLGSEAILSFAADYRAVAADLARARTYGMDRRTIDRLEAIVGGGHHLLYGARGVTRIPLGNLLLRELPAAAYRQRMLIAVAALAFLVPGIAGWTMVRTEPELAYATLPATIIERAESGVQQQGEGPGYGETPSPLLPIVASSIIANNVQVALAAFAFGITAGIGTVLLLVFNGLFFGAVMGLFANRGVLEWILTFVAGHGVLELTAIFIAGAGGLLIARAIVAPGDLARREALVIWGREALLLVGNATFLLILAGTIEGFLSASDAAPTIKYSVSATSVVLLGLYFLAGRSRSREGTIRTSPANSTISDS